MKKFYLIFLVLLLFGSLSVSAFSGETNIDSYADEFSFDVFTESLSDEAVEILSEMGIDEISYSELFSVSPENVLNVFFNVLSGSLKKPLYFCFAIFGVMFITSVSCEISKLSETVSFIGTSLISIMLCVPVSTLVSTSVSVTNTVGNLIVSFCGVFCGIVSASGGTLGAVAFEGSFLFFNSAVSKFTELFSKPFINGMCSLAFFSCFDAFSFMSRTCEMLKKTYIWFLGFTGMIFTSFISLKTVLASGADSVASKSIKFIVGKSVPVVGSTLSESYSSVMAGLSLIKSTVGVFGIISVALTVLPTVLSLLCWMLSLNFVIAGAEAFSLKSVKGVLCVFKDVLSLLFSTVLFVSVVFIISAGVLITVKGGV